MEKNFCLRFLRRVCTAIFVLLLLLICSAQVMAEEPETDVLPAAAEEETGLTEENFAAVAAQLRSVARAEGRAAADRMLYASFREVSEMSVETPAQTPTASDEGLNIIVVQEKAAMTFSDILPFLLAAVIVVSILLAAILSHRRRRLSGRKVTYKPLDSTALPLNPYVRYKAQQTYR